MKIFNELKNENEEKLSLILGFFDGIHKGHKEVIHMGVQYARDNDYKSALVTFRESPAVILQQKTPQYILPIEEKIKKIEKLGVDYLYIIDFNEELAKVTAQNYLKNLVEKLHPMAITTGDNHFFGFNKTGTSDYLDLMQHSYGYRYFRILPVKYKESTISSSKIRKALSEGDLNTANLMLGYRFYVKGEVVHGRHIGRTIGFKTANLDYPDKLVKIPDGVYAVEVETDGKKYIGIANYGSNPTVTDDTKKLIEVHIVHFDENIYGKVIKVSFLDKIRDEMKFKTLSELKEQIAKDIKCLKL